MDEIEQSMTDPRDEFHHNYLTDADRKRAETRRKLEFPGLYSSPEEAENGQPGVSGLNCVGCQHEADLAQSGVSKSHEKTDPSGLNQNGPIIPNDAAENRNGNNNRSLFLQMIIIITMKIIVKNQLPLCRNLILKLKLKLLKPLLVFVL